jgi:hypothetical protein
MIRRFPYWKTAFLNVPGTGVRPWQISTVGRLFPWRRGLARFLIALDQWTGAFQLTVNSEQLTATRPGFSGAATEEAALMM